MLILGVSSFKNDTAAALLNDGVIEAAIENEKLEPGATRGVPEAAISFCLEKAKELGKSVDVVAVASSPFHGWRRRAFSRVRLSPLAPVASAYQLGKEIGHFSREWTRLRSLKQKFARTPAQMLTLDHHLCHAAGAFFLSPFQRALIVTLDGEGDGRAGLVAVGENNQLRCTQAIHFAHSVGWVYSRITDLLGFIPHREEHKTQWLSLEGTATFRDEFLRMLRRPGSSLPCIDFRYFQRDFTGSFEPSDYFYRRLGLPAEKAQLTPEDKRNLAASLQAALTDVVTDLIAFFREKTGIEQICLGGGVFHNTLLITHLEQEFGRGNVYVPPGPGNAGTAIGATTCVWHQQRANPRLPEISAVYLGPSYARNDVKETLDNAKARYELRNTMVRKVETAVQLLQAGKIVGWFQGATEFGPRTLGHRSILASPWAPYVIENLNDFVKHRESFRPFAVAVPEEDCSRYFIASPLCRIMNSLASVKSGTDILPGPLQLTGGLVRLYVVERRVNPLFWELLKCFGEQNGAPILVNTSFNLPREPAVVRPRDAVRTYFCSGIDAVFIDNFLLTKWSAAHILKSSSSSVSSVNAHA